MAKLRPIPLPTVPFVDANGLISPVWYEYLRGRELIGTANLIDVSETAPSNGQVLVYNSTTGKYAPGSN